jgi:hypothetical protein
MFTSSSSSVSVCSKEFFLDIFSSKGLTYRNPTSVTWNVLSVASITTSAQRNSLNSMVSANFANMRHVKFDEATIATLANKSVEFRVTATNFLGKSGTKDVLIYFLNTKKIVLDGYHPNYVLLANVDQKFYLSAYIPI